MIWLNKHKMKLKKRKNCGLLSILLVHHFYSISLNSLIEWINKHYPLPSILCIFLIIFFRYYRVTNELGNRMNSINDQREEVRRILTIAKQAKKQREQINAILAQDESFKIGGYFNALLDSLQLTEKKQAVDYSHI